ncbi:MAG: PBP1A family penicillin-binding protein [Acetobacteraceae bacterium]|nr:PBP1A family penicillin-binding protein [Acetobacteraceae bacterium]
MSNPSQRARLVPPLTQPASPPKKPKAPRSVPRFWGIGRLARILLAGLMLAGLAGLALAVAGYRLVSSDLPNVSGLQSYQPRIMSRVYAGDARLMSELATERRIFVPYSAIPELVRQAFVSAEDQNFWVHRGFDPIAMTRAAVKDVMHLREGRRPGGASTITQQVAKNMLLGNELSLVRKIKELILATRIEETLSKERILELYLNEIYFGMQSYGVAAAAQAYFNKALDELTVPEAAFLAALPKGPNNYNPYRFPDAARARRDWVLDRMVEDHAITPEQALAAKAQPVVPSQFHRPEPIPGSEWFAEEVRRRLIDRFGADTSTQGGLTVRTTLDPSLQLAAEKALRDGLLAYDRHRGGWRGAVGHVAAAPALRNDWAAILGQQPRPSGMLPEWRLAIVTDTSESDAKLGWLERDPQGQAHPHTGSLTLSELGWARPVKEQGLGPPPRRMTDVVQAGDLVMIEPTGAMAAKHGTSRVERVQLRQIPEVQGALVSLDPSTGRVLAMVGGWSFEQSQFNRATQALRQPGSSFKPIVYLTALEQDIPPSQRFQDGPIVIGDWRPSNYGGTFSGPVPMRIALEKSLNLVTIRIAQRVGMEAVAQTAIAFHVVDNMPRVLPTALGAVDTTVLRMAGAYASLAEGGREVVPTLIDSVQDRDGHVVWRAAGRECDPCGDLATPPNLTDTRNQIADPASVFQLVTMMEGVVKRGTGFEAGKGMKRPIAGKTGTTQDFNDAWFVGFTPDLVTAVWVGFDQPASLGDKETGGAIAAPIWRNYMTVALKNRPVLDFTQPPDVTLARWDSGYGVVTDAFKTEQKPGGSVAFGGGGGAAAESESILTGPAPAGGIDTSMGGLY